MLAFSSHLCSKLGTIDGKEKRLLRWAVGSIHVLCLWGSFMDWQRFQSEHTLMWSIQGNHTHTQEWLGEAYRVCLYLSWHAERSPVMSRLCRSVALLQGSRRPVSNEISTDRPQDAAKLNHGAGDSQILWLLLHSRPVQGKQEKSLWPTDWNWDDGLLVMAVGHSAIQTATHSSSQMETRAQLLIYSQIWHICSSYNPMPLLSLNGKRWEVGKIKIVQHHGATQGSECNWDAEELFRPPNEPLSVLLHHTSDAFTLRWGHEQQRR